MKGDKDCVKMERPKPTLRLCEIDIKNFKDLSGLGLNEDCKIIAKGSINNLNKGEYGDDKGKVSITFELKDVQVILKDDENAISKIKSAKTLDELDKAAKGEGDE